MPLRVLAGPTPDKVEDITHLVNTNKAFTISSDSFNGKIAVHLKGFVEGKDEYFEKEGREDVTWSIQAQGSFCLG